MDFILYFTYTLYYKVFILYFIYTLYYKVFILHLYVFPLLVKTSGLLYCLGFDQLQVTKKSHESCLEN